MSTHPNRILRLGAVIERVGLKRSSIYRLARAGKFPAPVKLGPRAVGWHEADIEAWIASRAGQHCIRGEMVQRPFDSV